MEIARIIVLTLALGIQFGDCENVRIGAGLVGHSTFGHCEESPSRRWLWTFVMEVANVSESSMVLCTHFGYCAKSPASVLALEIQLGCREIIELALALGIQFLEIAKIPESTLAWRFNLEIGRFTWRLRTLPSRRLARGSQLGGVASFAGILEGTLMKRRMRRCGLEDVHEQYL